MASWSYARTPGMKIRSGRRNSFHDPSAASVTPPMPRAGLLSPLKDLGIRFTTITFAGMGLAPYVALVRFRDLTGPSSRYSTEKFLDLARVIP